jgi:hypothetical protein
MQLRHLPNIAAKITKKTHALEARHTGLWSESHAANARATARGAPAKRSAFQNARRGCGCTRDCTGLCIRRAQPPQKYSCDRDLVTAQAVRSGPVRSGPVVLVLSCLDALGSAEMLIGLQTVSGAPGRSQPAQPGPRPVPAARPTTGPRRTCARLSLPHVGGSPSLLGRDCRGRAR